MVGKIEFSAENAMVGRLLFWAERRQGPGLAFPANFEFLRRKKTVLLSSPWVGLYVRYLCTYVEARPGRSSLSGAGGVGRGKH